MRKEMLSSKCLDREVSLWLKNDYGFDGQLTRIVIFLDGEYYLEKLNAVEIIDKLGVQDTCLAFVSHGSSELRQTDYVCNQEYSSFISRELVPVLMSIACSKQSKLTQIGICGLSLSGLESAFVSLSNPDLFSFSVCQSPSSWWNSEWLAANIARFGASATKFWISVGSKETQGDIYHAPLTLYQENSQIETCKSLAESMTKNGFSVRFAEFDGGHAFENWKIDLENALKWFLM